MAIQECDLLLAGRAPHGARGLKRENLDWLLGFEEVAPHTGRVD